jgi:catechol 2,3-dioxygenase-like lactoylglutathione lyase family enzyme
MKTKFIYVGIRVKDLQQSIDFYVNILGMNLKARYMIEETKGEIAILNSDDKGFELELNYYERNSPYNTPYVLGEGLDHLAFKVDNLDNALIEAKRLGYPCIQDIKTANNRWAYIEDPNGIWIELN